MSTLVEIGFVLRAHGIRGEVVVVTHDAESTVFELDPLEVVVRGKRYRVRAARPGAHGLLVAFDGVTDRNVAETLRGAAIEVARELVAADDELLLDELIGFAVVTVDGRPWGYVTALELGPQDRLVIEDGPIERLLPMVEPLLVEIDAEAKRITIDVPDGWPEAPVRARGPHKNRGPHEPNGPQEH